MCELARTNAEQDKFEDGQLSIADTDDELTHVAGVLAAQRYRAFAVDQPSQIGSFRR
jgi:hypothetical protein